MRFGIISMKSRKGLVISLSTLLIFIVLVWFASFYSGKVVRQEEHISDSFAIEKAGFVADDIVFDINRVLGAGYDVNKGLDFMILKLNDKISVDNNREQLLDLESFLEGDYATRQSASIVLDFSELLDGATELKFSNGLVYEHGYDDDFNFVQLRNVDASNTGALTYDINVFVQGAQLDTAVFWGCGSSGDVNVNLRYKDSFGESENLLGCKRNFNAVYSSTFTFVDLGGDITVRFGNVDGNLNAVRVKNTVDNPSVDILISIGMELPSPSNGIYWYYDADLNYVQGNVELNRKIELGRA